MSETDFLQLINRINQLWQFRKRLLANNLSPEGAWIHEYEVRRTYPSGVTATYYYAKWQSHEPIFKRNPKKRARPLRSGKDPGYTCHQHIGRVGSTTGLGIDPEVEDAYQEWNNRRQMEAIDLALNEIQAVISKFEHLGAENESEAENV